MSDQAAVLPVMEFVATPVSESVSSIEVADLSRQVQSKVSLCDQPNNLISFAVLSPPNSRQKVPRVRTAKKCRSSVLVPQLGMDVKWDIITKELKDGKQVGPVTKNHSAQQV
jgi:hypothetical protein